MAKTDWGLNDKVTPDDMNAIGQEINTHDLAIKDKLDKDNPAASGVLSLGNSFFRKYLGIKNTISNSPNQKMRIEFSPVALDGYLDITITGGYDNIRMTGALIKRFSGTLTAVSPSAAFMRSKYIEATDYTKLYLRIGELGFDAVKGVYFIPISFTETHANPQKVGVMVTVFGGLSANPSLIVESMKNMELTNFIADAGVLPVPVISMDQLALTAPQDRAPLDVVSTKVNPNLNSELHNGWKVFSSQQDIGLGATNTVQEHINAMPDKSILRMSVSSGNREALGLAPFWSVSTGLIEFIRINSSRIMVTAEELGGGFCKVKAFINGSGNFQKWVPVPSSDSTEQTNLNAQLHHGWQRYETVAQLGLTAVSTMQQMFDAMANKSELSLVVQANNYSILDLPSTDYGLVYIKKQDLSRSYAKFYSNKGKIDKRGNFDNTGKWLGWIDDPVSDGTEQKGLVAESASTLIPLAQNSRKSTDLPIAFPVGMSVMFSNNAPAADRFNGLQYATVITTRPINSGNALQVLFPYTISDEGPLAYRWVAHNRETWGPWESISTLDSPAFTGTPTAPTPTSKAGIANKGYVDGLLNGIKIVSGENLNNYRTPGRYYVESTAIAKTIINSPFTNAFGVTIDPIAASWVIQKAVNINGIKKFRIYNGDNSTWSSDWEELPKSDGSLQKGLNTESHNGWKRFTTMAEFGGVSTDTFRQLADKMPNYSIYHPSISSAALLAPPGETNGSGTITKYGNGRVEGIFSTRSGLWNCYYDSNTFRDWERTATTEFVSTQIDTQTRFATTAGSATAFTASFTPAVGSYVAGLAIKVKLHTNSGTNPTLNVNGLGAKALYNWDGTRFSGGVSGRIYTFTYDGTNFIQSSGGGGTKEIVDVLTSKGIYATISETGMEIASRIDEQMIAKPGYVWESTTGIDSNYAPTSVIHDGTEFVSVVRGAVLRSPDGLNWTVTNVSILAATITKLFYLNGTYIALAKDSASNYAMFTSTNKTTWTARTISGLTNPTLSFIAYGNGAYVAVEPSTNRSFRSTNLSTWTTTNFPNNPDDQYGQNIIVGLTYSEQHGGFLFIDSIYKRVWISATGNTNFTSVNTTGIGQYIFLDEFDDVKAFGNTIVATSGSNLFYSTNLASWTQIATPFTASSNTKIIQVFEMMRYFMVGSSSTRVAFSKDLITWDWINTSKSWNDIAYGNNTFSIVSPNIVPKAMVSRLKL